MSKMGGEGMDGVGFGVVVYVEEGVEFVVGVGVVVEDGFVEGRVVVWLVFGVVFIVFFVVGLEGLFSFLVRYGGLVVMMERGCCKRWNCLKDLIGNRYDERIVVFMVFCLYFNIFRGNILLFLYLFGFNIEIVFIFGFMECVCGWWLKIVRFIIL